MPPHYLANFEIQKYYHNEPKLNGWAFVINIDESRLIATHLIVLYVSGNNIIYFDSFGDKHIPKEIEKFIGNKNIITNIHGIEAYNSIMCRYFFIGFIDFILKGKTLLHYTNLFSPNEYEKE